MSSDETDLALHTLLNNRNQVAPNLDEQLLRQCYAIQKKYQFSADRAPSVSAMERLVDSRIPQAAD